MLNRSILFIFPLFLNGFLGPVFGVDYDPNSIHNPKKKTGHWQIDPEVYVDAYSDYILGYAKTGELIWKDETRMRIHRPESLPNMNAITQDFQKTLDNPDLYGQIALPYVRGKANPDQKTDSGRIRYDDFFKKMYGDTQDKVKSNLTTLYWMPKVFQQTYPLQVTTINDVDKKLEWCSHKLEQLCEQKPEYIKFLEKPGGTFCWRTIAGTDRMSAHSYGMTIDINVDHSDYWLWDYKRENNIPDSKVILEKDIPSNTLPKYRNKIPQEIVDIFESQGFIWGGKWHHYDTMHFEYRPELLIQRHGNT
jgi:peptidoglycan L-alanyl-D-glutamate endopeptidase CwlK